MPAIGFTDLVDVPVLFKELTQTYTPNRWGKSLPLLKALARAARRKPYCEYSATELASDPLRLRLQRTNDYYVNPDEVWWAFWGTMAHKMLYGRGLRPLTTTINGVLIGGTPDAYERKPGLLTDEKTGAVYALNKILANGVEAERPEWVAQTNIYAWLLREAGHKVTAIQIEYTCRDWRNWERNNPPRTALLPVPLWEQEHAGGYIRARVHGHVEAAQIPVNFQSPCVDREAFGLLAGGQPRRCAAYCDVRHCCPHARWAGQKPKENT